MRFPTFARSPLQKHIDATLWSTAGGAADNAGAVYPRLPRRATDAADDRYTSPGGVREWADVEDVHGDMCLVVPRGSALAKWLVGDILRNYRWRSTDMERSVDSTARFRQGSCVRKRAGGTRLLQVRIGARSLDGSRTNDGLASFSLGITGSRSQRVSGNVLAYYRSRRWIGRISSFNGGEDGGTFITLSIAASARHATGRFSC